MKKLITIFSFTKLFHEAYRQNSPLDNFSVQLQELINIDIIELIEANKARASEKSNAWQEEAYRNFERIGKIGITPSTELNLDNEPSELWDCSFMRALRIFNERNFYVTNCLSNKKSFKENENLIKSQIKLEVFRNLPLELYIDKSKSELQNPTDHLNENFELKPSIIIQEKYLERFINSLDNFTLGNSKNNLLKIFRGENITEDIKFSCPANSVIKFFKDRHTEQIIVSSKADIAKFISTYFMFKKKQTQEFAYPKLENIKNYLTRSLPPSGTSTTIPFVES
ncbi:hypothetical protein [Chryseobacterium oranimense]|uniref:hypothetical protein n=1 Tax=Chryseobacterium oranimense TaxID=421058 RepID=UPI002236A746|nr:hypothetical protein [Chryseobacterium oranimense]